MLFTRDARSAVLSRALSVIAARSGFLIPRALATLYAPFSTTILPSPRFATIFFFAALLCHVTPPYYAATPMPLPLADDATMSAAI